MSAAPLPRHFADRHDDARRRDLGIGKPNKLQRLLSIAIGATAAIAMSCEFWISFFGALPR
jgi:hypothetical protein